MVEGVMGPRGYFSDHRPLHQGDNIGDYCVYIRTYVWNDLSAKMGQIYITVITVLKVGWLFIKNIHR